MVRRRPDESQDALPEQEQSLLGDDAFLSDLSIGIDRSKGTDPLSSLLLGLRDEVNAPMPEAPEISEKFMEQCCVVSAEESEEAETEFFDREDVTNIIPVAEDDYTSVELEEQDYSDNGYPVDDYTGADYAENNSEEDSDNYDESDDSDDTVVPFTKRKNIWGLRGSVMSGVIGAAAATLLIAGMGTAIHSAKPGNPLWGMNTKLFGDHAAVVQLASTLEEADMLHSKGDVNGALQLLEQARELTQNINIKDRDSAKRSVDNAEARIITETVTASPTTPAPATAEEVTPPVTVTVTATVTQTVTVPHAPAKSDQVAPTTNPTPSPHPGEPHTTSPNPPGDGNQAAVPRQVGGVRPVGAPISN